MAFVKTQPKFGKVRFEVNEYDEVIQKQFDEHPEAFKKCHTQCSLVSWWNILQSKRHDYPHKCSPIYDDCNFVHVFQGNHYLMIPQKAIQK
jgi:hypothetical protein